MTPQLNVGDYVNRSCIILGMLVLIECLQLPLIFVSHVAGLWFKVGLIVLYFALYALAIGIAWRKYRDYHPAPVGKLTANNAWLVAGTYVLFLFYSALMTKLSTLVFHQSQSANNANIKALLGSSPLVMVAMLVGIVILSPIVEELVFRGLIVDGLFAGRPLIWPMLVSGVVFASAHAFSNPFLFLVYGGMGAAMVFLYRKTRTLKANIFFHMLNNGVAALGMVLLMLK